MNKEEIEFVDTRITDLDIYNARNYLIQRFGVRHLEDLNHPDINIEVNKLWNNTLRVYEETETSRDIQYVIDNGDKNKSVINTDKKHIFDVQIIAQNVGGKLNRESFYEIMEKELVTYHHVLKKANFRFTN